MPFWYVHMEAAKQAVDRLRAGNVPADFPGGPKRAKELGDIAHKWRNYLALGAIGPDLFYFVPDYRQSFARNDLATLVYWFRTKWDQFEKLFLNSWNQYAEPAVSGNGAVLNQITGGLLRELGEAQQEIARVAANLLLDVVANLWHWFGLFGSGVSSGVSETEFFWSDMFHYRKTYTFARRLFEKAQSPDFQQNMTSEQLQAFAIGWMTHCATDVTGHPFVNEKVGGPWRLHWQRHHVVEFHMDARVYDTQHGGMEPYGELDTSCSHFRVAFRKRNDGDYATPDGAGFNDAPAYDYFAGFPPYDTTLSDIGDINRGNFFDLKTGAPTQDLYKLLIDTMKEVYYPAGDTTSPAPQILRCSKNHDGDSGRPNENTLDQTVGIVYDFLKAASTAGYSPPPPSPPPLFNDHRPPPIPQPNEDTARGSDPQNLQNDIIAVFFAVYGLIRWLEDFGLWLATLPDQLLADLLTYAPRQLLYELAVSPLYSLYIAMRQPLVMSGFLIPKRSEISVGLIQLGVSPSAPVADLVAALASAGAVFPESPPASEPSGRVTTVEGGAPAFEVDQEYPRDAIEDRATVIESFLFYKFPSTFANMVCNRAAPQPSEYLRSWRYPLANNEKLAIVKEKERTHAGPWFQGQLPEILMNGSPGDPEARAAFEAARTPEETESLCEKNFPAGKHLGDPVDYSVYLVGRLTNNDKNASFPPDFNLDSDRGYGYHCWDWKRTNETIAPDTCPADLPPNDPVKFDFSQACTVPQGFCNWNVQPRIPNYDPSTARQIFYEDGPASPVCEGNTGGNVVPK